MGEYHVGKVGDREAAGMMEQAPEQRGMPATWTVFIHVEDVDRQVEAVAGTGGRVLQPPFEIPGGARVAVVADPTGSMFALISGGPRPHGAYFSFEPGMVCWVEVLTRDPAAAESFYASAFGWKAATDPGTGYTVFELDGEQLGGMMLMPAQVPAEAPSHWSVYFAVEDCEGAAARAAEAGGTVLVPATPYGMGRFAMLADPQGATFGVMDPLR
jgi:predicted enzyme related to lactoylglutathione lyase